MRGSIGVLLIILSTLLVAVVLPSLAEVPPPPVNQLIGIDGSFSTEPTEAYCRNCHDSGSSDRHHLLMNTVVPDPTVAPFGTPGSTYQCLSCHAQDTSSGTIVFVVERDCINCHFDVPNPGTSTPHHTTVDAQERHCSVCHGSVVQDYDDDHYVPDYDISNVTPDPVCKTWDGPKCVSGGCYVCHTEDATAVPAILSYSDTHHAVQFNCNLCHSMHGNIRDCESCHGPDSLHNIQADSDNAANIGLIVPGEEDFGWGHIGNGWDCFGCHESFSQSNVNLSAGSFSVSSTPQTQATIPSISSLSTNLMLPSQSDPLEVFGVGFVNQTAGIVFESDVILVNENTSITLEKVSITENRITALIPTDLIAGTYDLRVIKEDKKSNKEVISVVPPIMIDAVSCSNKDKVLIVTGSGFVEKPAGTDAYIRIEENGVSLDVLSWSDSEIQASVPKCKNDSVITVISLIGSDTYSESKPPKPCRGKQCNQ